MDELQFSFCPKCGSTLIPNTFNSTRCTVCNYVFYVNTRPCNAVILKNDNNEILLVKRAHEPNKNTWDLPGGFIDIHEELEESAKREIKEELSIDITNIQYFTSTYDRYLYGGVNLHTLCITVTATYDQVQTIIAADDALEYRWFSINNIPWDTLAFKGMETTLRRFTKAAIH
jgi:NAD+ diphosphatase